MDLFEIVPSKRQVVWSGAEKKEARIFPQRLGLSL